MSKQFVGTLGADNSGITITGLLTDVETKTVETVKGSVDMLGGGTVKIDIAPKPDDNK